MGLTLIGILILLPLVGTRLTTGTTWCYDSDGVPTATTFARCDDGSSEALAEHLEHLENLLQECQLQLRLAESKVDEAEVAGSSSEAEVAAMTVAGLLAFSIINAARRRMFKRRVIEHFAPSNTGPTVDYFKQLSDEYSAELVLANGAILELSADIKKRDAKIRELQDQVKALNSVVLGQ